MVNVTKKRNYKGDYIGRALERAGAGFPAGAGAAGFGTLSAMVLGFRVVGGVGGEIYCDMPFYFLHVYNCGARLVPSTFIRALKLLARVVPVRENVVVIATTVSTATGPIQRYVR